MSYYRKGIGALIVGALLALPLAAWAQAPASNPAQPDAPGTKALSGAPPAPTTAPKAPENVKPVAPMVTPPAATSPPAPGKGSTAVPGWNNPPAWGSVSQSPQYASVPGREYNVLIQGAGREWRVFRNGPLTQAGGWLLVLALASLTVFYLIVGPIKLHAQPTGRLIERFNAVERAAHWTTAITFVVLALTGLIMFFGKHIILPWLGYAGFSWLTQLSKNLHNFIGPLFMFAILVTFLLYVKDNWINGEDFKWLSNIGGVFKGTEYPSGRFNMIEKLWFWGGLALLGVVMSVTGLILDFPNWNQTREAMQVANMVHVVAAVLFIAGSFLHIYVGTIGMVGAYRAMRDGYVDEAWAKEHHAYWYEEVKEGRRPEKIVSGTPLPATGD
jgi:formate dehydrogenase subunit gamma